MTVVEQIYKDIEITFDIHDAVRKYFESRKGEWLQKEKEQLEKAWQDGAATAQSDAAKEIENNYVARVR